MWCTTAAKWRRLLFWQKLVGQLATLPTRHLRPWCTSGIWQRVEIRHHTMQVRDEPDPNQHKFPRSPGSISKRVGNWEVDMAYVFHLNYNGRRLNGTTGELFSNLIIQLSPFRDYEPTRWPPRGNPDSPDESNTLYLFCASMPSVQCFS